MRRAPASGRSFGSASRSSSRRSPASTRSIAAKKRESELIETERVGVEELRRKKLVTVMRVTEVERAAAQIEGERSQLVAAAARARAEIAETELQIIQIEQDLRAEVGRELAEIRAKVAELRERKVAAADQLARVDIRAPQDGFVHQLAVHTIGGVVQPGETLMLIVPSADRLTVEAKIQPQEIDRVKIGQPVALRFSAFDQRTTPEIEGSVSLVSADVSHDERTGLAFYTARIEVAEGQLARLGELRLVPGMPVDSLHPRRRADCPLIPSEAAERSDRARFPRALIQLRQRQSG